MNYYAKCNNVFNTSEVNITNENDEILFIIKHKLLKTISGLTVLSKHYKKIYQINYNPLKLKNQFIIINKKKEPIIKISLGLKLIHKIEYKTKTYICKASFLKINYRLYDGDKEIGSVKVTRVDKQRYFEIYLDNGTNEIFAMCLFVLAQTMRDRVWFIY